MKFSQAISLVTTLATLVAGAVPPSYLIPPFVVGRQFFLNGKIQRFVATNAWWLGHLYTDADVEFAVSEIAASGVQVVRTWGFGNSNVKNPDLIYYQLIEPNGTSINYGPNGIARLDAAVKYAEKYGLKLVLPMLNNFDDLGGINTYSAAFGCNATSFYTDPKAQEAYKGWIKFAINRYKKSPAIFAWELMNEPRCRQCSTSVITNWATDISKYIKSLDPIHMVALGDEGWFAGPAYGDGSYGYSGYEGVDFVANLAIKTLDYGTAHLYPNYWGYNNTWGSTWIQQHADAGKKARKPVVLEEYGCYQDDDAGRVSCMNAWQATARSSGIAVDQWWQFATTLPTAGTSLFDGFAIYYNTAKGSVYDSVVLQNVKAWLKAPLVF